jgi:solute carrier family 13 (sodium-dependent dicarboxylate transporter), member 2/3/5
MRQKIGLLGAPILFVGMLLLPSPEGMTTASHMTAAIALLMAWLWITEGIPIPATSLLPLALFPLCNITPTATVAASYGDKNIFLFMGGFFIAIALERWNLHRRIALHTILLVGTQPRRLIIGFIIASAGLSMWISNTATVLMMYPLALAILRSLEAVSDQDGDGLRGFQTAGMLAIAYAASIGGMATVIGTPPNLVFAGLSTTLYPEAGEVSFVRWLAVGLPVVLIFLPILAMLLIRLFRVKAGSGEVGKTVIRKRLDEMGSMQRGEKLVLFVFLLCAFGWIFRKTTDIGFITLPGWTNMLGISDTVDDAAIAIGAAVLLFLIPVDFKKGLYLLNWDEAKRIPWGILLLFGGGIAIATGFREAGLSTWVGERLSQITMDSPLILMGSVCSVMTFLTEMTSNTATSTIFLPIVGSLSTSLAMHPYLLMIPATLSASCAFMLPVATPTNAIVFSSGHVSILDMVKAGIVLNLVGIVLISVIFYFISLPILGLTAM